MKTKILIFILLLILNINNLSALFQTGNLAGRIIDEITQKPVENVAISIDGEAKGVCDNEGKYIIKDIPVGTHQLNYSRIGYETRTRLNFVIKANQTVISNVEMKVQSLVMEGISVTEEVFFRETSSAPVSSKTLDIEELKSQPSGVYDIQRSIQAIPAIVSGSDAENEIIVRGGNYGENLFVLDNIELQNPNHFAFPGTGGGPISMLTPEFVKQVDFYAGAFPARYGDRASSVLDITTRDGNENRFEAKLDVGMAGYGGNIEGPLLSKKGNFILSYHRSFMSLISESIGLTAVPNYHSIFAKQVINFSPFRKLTINQIWGSDWIDIVHEDGTTGYAAGAGEVDIYARSGQYTIGATLKSIYDKSFSQLTIFRNYHWWDQNLYDAGTKSDQTKTWMEDTSEAHNKLKYSHNFPNTKLGNWEAGLFANLDEASTNKFMRPDTVFSYIPGTDMIIDTLEVYAISESNTIKRTIYPKKYGTYLQWEDFFGKFTFNAGIRYDYFDHINKGSIAPRFGAKYKLTKCSNLSFGAGRQFQNPDYYTLTYNDENDDLKPKYTDQVVLGIDRLFTEDIKASVETYYKEYYDVPTGIGATTSDTLDWSTKQVNTGKGYARGMEFFLQKKVKDNFWGTISYSYSVAKAFDPRYPEEEKEFSWDFDYRHVFTGILGYKFQFMKYDWYEKHRSWMRFLGWTGLFPSDETEISVKYRYLGGKPYTELTYFPELKRWLLSENTEMNADRFPAYQRFDLHINHRWFENKINIISYLEIDNVFNTKNIWSYNYLDDGTTEETYQWGRMIIGGVMVEF